MKKENLGTILAIAAAVFSGIAIPVNKWFVVDLDPTVFTAVRALIIGIVFFFIASFQSKFKYKNFKKVSWKYLLAIAIIGGSFAFLMFFTGLKITTVGRGAFLHKTLPLFTAVLAYLFLREKINKKQSIALAVMLIGIVLIYFTQISPSDLWLNPSLGDLLIIGATVLWAIEIVIAKKAMIKGESNFVVSFSRMFMGGLILFAVLLIQGNISMLLSLTSQQMFNILVSTLVLLAYVLCWYLSIKLINISKASALLLLAPVISLFLGIVMFGEPAPIQQLIGSALILVGAYFITKIKSEFATGV